MFWSSIVVFSDFKNYLHFCCVHIRGVIWIQPLYWFLLLALHPIKECLHFSLLASAANFCFAHNGVFIWKLSLSILLRLNCIALNFVQCRIRKNLCKVGRNDVSVKGASKTTYQYNFIFKKNYSANQIHVSNKKPLIILMNQNHSNLLSIATLFTTLHVFSWIR